VGETTFTIEVTGQCGTSAAATVVVVRIEGEPAPAPKVESGCGSATSGEALPLAALLALAGLWRRRR
jgi:MYXO-CTERM domain-containing protein